MFAFRWYFSGAFSVLLTVKLIYFVYKPLDQSNGQRDDWQPELAYDSAENPVKGGAESENNSCRKHAANCRTFA